MTRTTRRRSGCPAACSRPVWTSSNSSTPASGCPARLRSTSSAMRGCRRAAFRKNALDCWCRCSRLYSIHGKKRAYDLGGLAAAGIPQIKDGTKIVFRRTKPKIPHNKFIVRLEGRHQGSRSLDRLHSRCWDFSARATSATASRTPTPPGSTSPTGHLQESRSGCRARQGDEVDARPAGAAGRQQHLANFLAAPEGESARSETPTGFSMPPTATFTAAFTINKTLMAPLAREL